MKTQTYDALASPGLGPSLSWQGKVDEAQGPDEVVALVRDFLARLSPEELSALPADCLPHKIVDADDVVDFAVTLVRRSCASESLSDALVQQMASFFTDACGKLSELGRGQPTATQ